MGQAKKRGDYEQRRTTAIARAKAEQAEQDRLSDLRYACPIRCGRDINPFARDPLDDRMLRTYTLVLTQIVKENQQQRRSMKHVRM